MGVEGRCKVILRKIFICCKVCVNYGTLYDAECLQPGRTTECEGVQNGVVKKCGV